MIGKFRSLCKKHSDEIFITDGSKNTLDAPKKRSTAETGKFVEYWKTGESQL